MVATKQMTIEEFEQLPDDGNRYELVRGELRQMPAGGLRHGWYGHRVSLRVGSFVEEHQLGLGFISETGFRIFPDQETVFMPDFAFIRLDKLQSIADLDKIGCVVPDLVVEVESPTDRWSDVLAKVADYLAAGVRLVWVVRPKERSVFVFSPDRPPREYLEQEVLAGEEVLPGFALSVADIFVLPVPF